jgi:hypothetical protein
MLLQALLNGPVIARRGDREKLNSSDEITVNQPCGSALRRPTGPTRRGRGSKDPQAYRAPKIQFNGVGRLPAYMGPTPNADVSALGSGGEAQC